MDKIKQKGKDIIKNPFSFLLFSILYLELLIRIKIFSHISLSFLYIILFSISLSFLLMMLCEIFTKSTQQIILSVLLFLLGLYFCSQILYYDYFKVFLTIYSIGNGTQVAEFYKDIIDCGRCFLVENENNMGVYSSTGKEIATFEYNQYKFSSYTEKGEAILVGKNGKNNDGKSKWYILINK